MTAASLIGFAHAADDSRAVIDYMHSWAVPVPDATPLTCSASGEIHYDVSISSDSGLQVPRRMVAGTEGREFTLTVANAGPDEATGTAIVNATDQSGNILATFPRTFTFTLNAGASTSWTESFSVDYATTVDWTATAEAPYDVNTANNTVTETTVVTGGGGGGH